MTSDQLHAEFERQVQNLIHKEYPRLAGLSKEQFLALVAPLEEQLDGLQIDKVDLENGYLPFVIVVKDSLISAEEMMAQTELKGKEGVTKLFPRESKDFAVIDTISLPSLDVYLLVDIDRGKETLNITPEEAFTIIRGKNRSPLTIAEGIALITQFPDFLIKNNCFSLLASRFEGDQRVPAIWINANKQPNLGWCWDRNPHTWLGSASCKERLA